jgi:glycosyltransferase involved in cell wall biosynthesis
LCLLCTLASFWRADLSGSLDVEAKLVTSCDSDDDKISEFLVFAKKDAPLVAIVTPVYNGARFIGEALESVQNLDYPNLVHIVLDNACTDGTDLIIQSYEGRRVPIITKRNGSVLPICQNWNAAIAMVPPDAKYFHLLCADDTFPPHSISRRVAIAETDPQIGLVACQWRAQGLCGEELPRDREVFDGQELLRSYFRREHSGLSGMFTLVRTTKIDPGRPFYDPTIVAAHDTDVNLRIATTSKVGFVHEELVNWRLHDEQASATYVQRGRHILFDWFILLDRYGPYVLGHKEYKACRRAYRRQYLRQMLLVRFRDNDIEVWNWHMASLRARDDAAGVLDFIDAFVDWGLRAVTGARATVGAPLRPAFGAPKLFPKLGTPQMA